MTKAEILACKDVHTIWSVMQEISEFQADRDVWNHITSLTWEKEKERIKNFFELDEDEIDPMIHIDCQKRLIVLQSTIAPRKESAEKEKAQSKD